MINKVKYCFFILVHRHKGRRCNLDLFPKASIMVALSMEEIIPLKLTEMYNIIQPMTKL